LILQHNLGDIFTASISFPNLRTYAGFQVPGLFSYNVRLRKRQSNRMKRGLYPKEIVEMVNHDNQEEDIDKLGDLENMEESLQSLWQDLDYMVVCTKFTMCSMRYQKNFNWRNVQVRANLVQSMTITMNRIRNVSRKIRNLKKDIIEHNQNYYFKRNNNQSLND